MHPILFHIPLEQFGLRDIPVYSYGFMMMLGFLTAITLTTRLGRRYGLTPNLVYDLSFLAIVSGVIGSRLMWILQESNPSMMDSYLDYFAVWQGGLVYYGGMILALLSGVIYIRIKKLPLGITLDCFAPGIAAGLGWGRLGCLLNGCCYGATCESEAWYSMIFPPLSPAAMHQHGFEATSSLSSLPVYPSQLLESLAGFLISGLLLLARSKRRFHGEGMLLFLQFYAVSRFLVEFLRADTELFWKSGFFPGLHPGQIVALITFSAAAVATSHLRKNLPALSSTDRGTP